MAELAQEFQEFIGPNMNEHNYCGARYRARGEIELELPSIVGSTKQKVIVPQYIEALRKDASWTQHPVLFEHTPERKNRANDSLVLLCKQEGKFKYMTFPRHELSGTDAHTFLSYAATKGLTQGSRHDLKMEEHENAHD